MSRKVFTRSCRWGGSYQSRNCQRASSLFGSFSSWWRSLGISQSCLSRWTVTSLRKNDNMDVSKNRGTPKCMVYNGKTIKMDDLGVPLFLETPTWIHNHHCSDFPLSLLPPPGQQRWSLEVTWFVMRGAMADTTGKTNVESRNISCNWKLLPLKCLWFVKETSTINAHRPLKYVFFCVLIQPGCQGKVDASKRSVPKSVDEGPPQIVGKLGGVGLGSSIGSSVERDLRNEKNKVSFQNFSMHQRR